MDERENTRYIGSVRFFKNLILLAVLVMIAVPSGLAIHFFRGLEKTKDLLREAQEASELAWVEDENGGFTAESPYQDLFPNFYAPQELNANTAEEGVVYLTFDDGPSPRTEEILNILKEKDVKATFFVIGREDEYSKSLMRRIVEEGHTIAMHSYTHNYKEIYVSVEAYLADMERLFNLVSETTGQTPTIFRFPGGSINAYNSGIYQDLIAEMLRRGFVPFDWNISSQDAAGKPLAAEVLTYNVTAGAGKLSRGVVLMHDAAAKATTVQALPGIIDALRAQGFELKALTPNDKPVLFPYRNAG